MSVQVGGSISGAMTLHVESCPDCGTVHAFADVIYKEGLRQRANRLIYCPNGHPWIYAGKTHAQEVKELKDRVAREQARRDQAEADANAARMREGKERQARKRLQERASAGVCPCCNRTFQQLARHMKRKHPEFVAAEHA